MYNAELDLTSDFQVVYQNIHIFTFDQTPFAQILQLDQDNGHKMKQHRPK